MISLINYLAFAIIGMSLQSVLFKEAKPDLVIILICFYTLRFGQFTGVVYAGTAGLVLDSASGFILGPNILANATAAFLVGLVRRKIFFWNRVINSMVVAAVTLVDILIVRGCLEVFRDISYSNGMTELLIIQTVLTTGVSLIVYPFFDPARYERFRMV
jgi:rod shape-determining protein MreD